MMYIDSFTYFCKSCGANKVSQFNLTCRKCGSKKTMAVRREFVDVRPHGNLVLALNSINRLLNFLFHRRKSK